MNLSQNHSNIADTAQRQCIGSPEGRYFAREGATIHDTEGHRTYLKTTCQEFATGWKRILIEGDAAFPSAPAQNFAELRAAIDPSVATSCLVLGYAAAFDGSGGTYVWSTDFANALAYPDDDGVIIRSALNPSGGAWRKLF